MCLLLAVLEKFPALQINTVTVTSKKHFTSEAFKDFLPFQNTAALLAVLQACIRCEIFLKSRCFLVEIHQHMSWSMQTLIITVAIKITSSSNMVPLVLLTPIWLGKPVSAGEWCAAQTRRSTAIIYYTLSAWGFVFCRCSVIYAYSTELHVLSIKSQLGMPRNNAVTSLEYIYRLCPTFSMCNCVFLPP